MNMKNFKITLFLVLNALVALNLQAATGALLSDCQSNCNNITSATAQLSCREDCCSSSSSSHGNCTSCYQDIFYVPGSKTFTPLSIALQKQSPGIVVDLLNAVQPNC